MLRLFSIFLLIVLVFSVQACAQSKVYVSSEGRFSIDLNFTPTEDRNSAESKLGGKKLWWRTESASFMVSFADNLDAKKEFAESAVNASADGYIGAIPKSAKVVSRKNIGIDGYPGVEIVSRESDGYTVVTRYFMVDTRLYCTMALWTAGRNDLDVIRTLDSFKVYVQSPMK
ncbi:MAG TPA: hypothetical protein PKD26_05900 [Pyrinomonadaceae bacterium]|nr:hypothetical protein [Pyrinomonadaceae bacterium]